MYVYPNTKFLWPQLLLNSWIDMDLKKYIQIQILEKMKLKKIGTFWVYMILVKILKLPAPPPPPPG